MSNLGYHCSRHTLGSLQVEAGTSVYSVQHILGHKNVSTTQIYAAMADESKRESINRITLKPAKNVQQDCQSRLDMLLTLFLQKMKSKDVTKSEKREPTEFALSFR